MSYQVIARKYRPQRFADVVGQDHVAQTLSNAVRQGRIAHAYIFCGPRGTGKTTLARIFAKCLNCTDGPRVDPPDDDPKCLEIAEGRSIDVLEIDGASNNGVEQVRELRETVKYAPASSRFKIYIIDEVHMLSTAAFNALLKTLEEPPAHVKFMFATTDPEKVLPTILSRCQRFDLRRIPAALIVKHLARIARDEGVEIDDAALHAIARGADGGMRDAESTLDQLISFCGTQITEGDVLSMFGLAARAQLLALTSALLAGRPADLLRELDGLARTGKDLSRLLADLLSHFRNLLVFKVSSGDLTLLEITEAEAGVLAEQAAQVDAAALGRILEVLSDTEGRLRDVLSKKIVLEVALLRAAQVRTAVSLDAVLQRLNQLREDAPGGEPPGTTAPAVPLRTQPLAEPSATPPVRPEPRPEIPEAQPTAPPPGAVRASDEPGVGASTDLLTLWRALLEAVGRASPFARSYLGKAFPVSLDRGVLVIGFEPALGEFLGLVDSPKNHALLQTKLRELGVTNPRVKFVTAEPADAVPAAAEPMEPTAKAVSAVPPVDVPVPVEPQASEETPAATGASPASPLGESVPKAEKAKPQKGNPEDFKDDPRIREALAEFKGTLVEVRR